jgi:hypothetical protein
MLGNSFVTVGCISLAMAQFLCGRRSPIRKLLSSALKQQAGPRLLAIQKSMIRLQVASRGHLAYYRAQPVRSCGIDNETAAIR